MSRQCPVTQAMLRSRRSARDRAAASRPGIKHDADVSTMVMMIVFVMLMTTLMMMVMMVTMLMMIVMLIMVSLVLIWMQMFQRRNPWGISSISESSLASASF